MKTRTKLVALGVAAVLAAGVGTYALSASAAGGFGPPHMRGMMGGHGMMMGGHGMNGARGPFGAAADPSVHLDTLKTELSITTDQEAAWAAYTKTVTDTATAMQAAVEGASTTDRQAFFATMQERMQTSFDTVRLAAEQLVASLDETQKAKAEQVLPGLVSGPMAMGAGVGHPPMRHGFGS
ncbi:MAG: Spy/CpxP family protein refolding chaperone [Devosia sp.]